MSSLICKVRSGRLIWSDSKRKEKARASGVAERTVPGDNDVALVRAMGTGLRFGAVDGGAEEVGAGVLAGRVDVVVLGILAHYEKRKIQRTIVCVERQSAVRTGTGWSEKMASTLLYQAEESPEQS